MLKNLHALIDLDLEEVTIIKDIYNKEKGILTIHIKGAKYVQLC